MQTNVCRYRSITKICRKWKKMGKTFFVLSQLFSTIRSSNSSWLLDTRRYWIAVVISLLWKCVLEHIILLVTVWLLGRSASYIKYGYDFDSFRTIRKVFRKLRENSQLVRSRTVYARNETRFYSATLAQVTLAKSRLPGHFSSLESIHL